MNNILNENVNRRQTCNGWGEIGGLRSYGYDSQTCPDCKGQGVLGDDKGEANE